jgi:PAS domain-containing protein
VNHVAGSTGNQAAADTAAVFVLAADGRIELAGAAAAALWGIPADALAGEFLPNVFACDVSSRDSGWVQSQWETLTAAAARAPVRLRILPRTGAAAEVTLRLEQVGAEPDRWLAFV